MDYKMNVHPITKVFAVLSLIVIILLLLASMYLVLAERRNPPILESTQNEATCCETEFVIW